MTNGNFQDFLDRIEITLGSAYRNLNSEDRMDPKVRALFLEEVRVINKVLDIFEETILQQNLYREQLQRFKELRKPYRE